MNLTLTGHHVTITPAIKEYVESKFSRVQRHCDRVLKSHVVLDIEKHLHKAEATLQIPGGSLHAEATAENMYAAIDMLTDKIDRLVKKRNERMHDHHPREASKARRAEMLS